eukprot:jgi/Astpho2/8902/fgenesh1_pm.00132_%23_3_t
MSDAGRSGDKDRRSKERDRPRGDSRHGDRRARDDKGERSSSRRDRRERSRSRERQRSRRSRTRSRDRDFGVSSRDKERDRRSRRSSRSKSRDKYRFGAGACAVARQLQEQQLKARQLVLQQQAASATAAASKTQREVYVGNLVAGQVTEEALRQLFNSTMMAAFPNAMTPGVDPVVNVSMHSEGRYAFVELRTPEMATAALQLSNQVQLLGQAISVGPPAPANPAEPSPYVQVEGMVSAQVLADDEEYKDIIEDLKEECGKHGTVVKVVAFAQFDTLQSAQKAKLAIHGRLFDGQTVNIVYISGATFNAATYGL